MKKYIILAWFLPLSVFLSACNDFLEVEPTSFISPENYYTTEQEATTALLGLYSVFNDTNVGLYCGLPLTGWVIPTDEVFRNAGSGGTNTLSHNATNPNIEAYWAQAFRYINNCNSFLENIDKPEMSEEKREVMRGEALFLRAYIYFLLVSQFGDVPLKLSSTQSTAGLDIEFSPAVKVYEQILSDMELAESKLQDAGLSEQQPMRVNKQVARGILARVNLYMAGYPIRDVTRFQAARDWAKSVVDAGLHNLNPDYTDIWIRIAQDQYDLQENMWEVEFQVPHLPYYRGTSWAQQTGLSIAAPRSNTIVGIMLDWYKVTYSLVALYETDTTDVRKNWNVANFYYRGSTAWETPRDSLHKTPELKAKRVVEKNPGKLRRIYEAVKPSLANSGQNFPILRFSDVLLMYAEAENELNGPNEIAIDLINRVRSRSGCEKLYTTGAEDPYFNITDMDSFRKAIQDERSRELCFEFTRRNDLIRWGIYEQRLEEELRKAEANNIPSHPINRNMISVYGRVAPKFTLLPIPASELSLNKLAKQNPNW